MTVLYNLGIRIYYLLLLIASLYNHKARLWIKGRKYWQTKMEEQISETDILVWFHASSLGEFEQGRPIIEAYRKEFPEKKILLTFYSPSGFDIRKDYKGADYIFYLPLDTKKNAREFIRIAHPERAIFIKYEFWFQFLKEIKNNKTELVLISAIFRSNQIFFKNYGRWFRNMLRFFDHIFVQDGGSFNLLQNIGIDEVTIAGDTRFDRVAQIAKESKQIEIADRFSEGHFTYICGSTWEKDEDILCSYINQSTAGVRFIIAPHVITEAHISALRKKIDRRVILYSEAESQTFDKVNVLLIDNIGLLSSIYRYGKVAYIGGGFGVGIHNVLEAAVYGMPVVFGPNFQKFREAVELVKEGGAFPIGSYAEFKELCDNFRENQKSLKKAAEATKAFVNMHMGATEVIMNYLRKS
jgi:3-deoxy-D-manno-octulosonic-acid transferase